MTPFKDANAQPAPAREPTPGASFESLTGNNLLVRNTLLNIVGQSVPFLAGIVTIPYVIRGIGMERFGVLSFAWILLGYFSLFDLGLGRATTKFISECLGRNEIDQLPRLVWTSLGFQLAVGALGAAVVAVLVPTIVERVLTVSPAYLHETKVSFLILALSLPIVLASAALRSVLESGQRFDLVNYVKVPANISVFVLPALAVACGLRLPGIISLLVLSRFITVLAHLALCLKVYPNLSTGIRFDPTMLLPLLRYGGWVTVSSVVSAFLASGDRFVIGALTSMTAVGYYTAPSEMANRFLVFPLSLILTLFPAFASLDARGAKQQLEKLYARSVKFLLLTLGPVLAVLFVFAREILGLWLGADFALKSTLVLQILAVGILINSLSCLPLTLIQGLGRPDVSAKFHLLELPLYAALLWVLVTRMGIPGAALAWTLRVGCDAFLLFGAASRLKFSSLRSLVDNGVLRCLAAVLLFGVLLWLPLRDGSALLTKIVLSVALLLPFAAGAWRFVLDDADRVFLAGSVSQVMVAIRGGE